MRTVRDYLLTHPPQNNQTPNPETAAEISKRKPPGKTKAESGKVTRAESVWSKRLTDLIRSAGWTTQREWVAGTGLGLQAIRSILSGKMPTVEFVRRLIALEKEHALELWIYHRTGAYRKGEITHADYMRDLEIYVKGHNQNLANVRALRDAQRRPQDLQALGMVGAAGERVGGGHLDTDSTNRTKGLRGPDDGPQAKPLRLVRVPPEPGPQHRDYKEDRPGRPPATRLRAQAAAAGLPGQVEATKGERS